MDKEQLKNMANNPDFIPGIYNYCDRWCERCPYTDNCFLYATEKQQSPDTESRDINNEAFWNEMEEIFRVTFELLEDTAEELGVDLNDIDAETAKEEETDRREQAMQHPAAKRAHQYITDATTFFENSEKIFEAKSDELAEISALEIPGVNSHEIALKLQDFIQVIRWYKYQIPAKIVRALRGKQHDFGWKEDPIQNDHNGSAKVALIGVDRSIAAWGGLLKTFPEKEDKILAILATLEQVRRQTEREFPDARKFVRPGFDE